MTSDAEWNQTIESNLTKGYGLRLLAAGITSNEAALKASLAMRALGRIGKAEGLAWLLDPENTWVTGQILGIDGGLGSR